MSGRRARIALINPNTNAAITGQMLALAREEAASAFDLEGLTVARGAALITNENALALAAAAVLEQSAALALADGVIVAGFGDPGVEQLRREVATPVVGIGEAALCEAAAGGRRFCVVTTTPELVGSLGRRVATLGLAANYGGVVLTEGDAVTVTGTPELLCVELGRAVARAIDEHGAEAIAIGGGPLASVGRMLADRSRVALIDPIGAAVRAMRALLAQARPSAAE